VLGHGVPQALRLMNEPIFNRGGNRVPRLIEAKATPESVVEELFLATYSRRPTGEELKECLGYLHGQGPLETGAARLLWVLLNSSEFILNH
jgi:hypothetical protein